VKASLLWLRDFLDRDVSAREVREILTARAATVEAVSPVRSDLAEIVVARVAEAGRHRDSEHLWLTRVDAGTGELIQVVCGAANVQAGASYPFAPVGATLPGGVKIEKRKIRGHVSFGMLCSAGELRLGSDHTGILALDTDAAPGTPLLAAIDAGDVRFEIDVLPNRPDLLSHEGIARELAAALGSELREWSGPPRENGEREKTGALPRLRTSQRKGITGGVHVRIEDAEGCPRYAAVVIRGISVGPSPGWLRERLAGAGVRSINNVVDVTNCMLHGFGQPMHAFDLATLGGEVVIRRAVAGERLLTLDGVERQLAPGTTVIAGASRAEAIAGVIGGQGSEVSESTTDILLEVAIFDPRSVRATRRALGISTEASYRFERHVDFERLPERARLAAGLIVRVAGGSVADAPVDIIAAEHREIRVQLRPSRVARVLGEAIPASEIARLLSLVGFEPKRVVKGAIPVVVPSWRSDVAEEIDLIEEVARLRGYDSFPSNIRPFRPTTVPDDPEVGVVRTLRQALAGEGLLEVRPIPFSASASSLRLRVRNPLAENEAYLRESLLPTLARRAEYNLAQMQRSIRLFEIGTVFTAGTDVRPQERTHAGALLMGHSEPPHFTAPEPRPYDVWDAKRVAELIVRSAFASTDLRFNVSRSAAPEAGIARPLWTLELDGRNVGRVVLMSLDAPVWASPSYGVEVDLSGAAERGRSVTTYEPLPITPPVEVDIALVVPDSVTAATVEEAIQRLGGDILERAMLFDEFRGAGVEPGSRSLAWRLTFRHPERTLRDQEVESRRQKLLSELQRELGVHTRSSQ